MVWFLLKGLHIRRAVSFTAFLCRDINVEIYQIPETAMYMLPKSLHCFEALHATRVEESSEDPWEYCIQAAYIELLPVQDWKRIVTGLRFDSR